MSTSNSRAEREEFLLNAVEASIRIGLVVLLAFYTLQILRPFLGLMIWGIVIAISTRPLYLRLERAVGGRSGLAASLFATTGLALIIGPALTLAGTLADGVGEIGKAVEAGQLTVPAPPDFVADWPVVGASIDRFWNLASTNLEAALSIVDEQLKGVGLWLLNRAADAGLGVLLLAVSIVIAAVLQTSAEASGRLAQAMARRIAGERGPALTQLVESTIRGVTRGVLGVALIQALAAGIGMLLVGVPVAGLWALLILLMAIIQLPTILLLLPIAIYVFTYASTVPAVLFLIWSLVTALSDNVLKPLLLARGVEVPMLVVLLGALGGFASTGLIGLFVGPVVVGIAYRGLGLWLEVDEPSPQPEPAANG